MTKDHARKRRARNAARSTGTSFTSANARIHHVHPAPTMIPVSGMPFGVPRTADMTAAAAAMGAGLADCESCLAFAMARLMMGDSLVLAVMAASLDDWLPEGAAAVTAIVWKDVRPRGNEFLYAFIDRLRAVERQNFITDLVEIWTAVLSRLTRNRNMVTDSSLASVIIDLTPGEPPTYEAARTGFVPAPEGPFPALTLTSQDFTGSIEDLAERCGFPLYAWNTLPDISEWKLEQQPTTGLPWGVRRTRDDGCSLTIGSPQHRAEADEQWIDAALRAGSVLVLGLWGADFPSLVYAVEASEIFAVRAQLQA
ncbi:hypothetical protein AB0F03_36090 [Streptomyces sp. NPDC028722]|uniref:hypothetical protein n=1 Tax=Streptomyces sp. NPDC028722 TaxID=3155016 RepID=UPI0033CAC4EB